VLLVEDNQDHSALIQAEIEAAGMGEFDVMVVGTLTAALAALADFQPDIALLDLTLPEAAGIDTLQRFRAAAPAVPVIVCSADDSEKMALQAIQEGAQDYFTKMGLDGKALRRTMLMGVARHKLQDTWEKLKKINEDLCPPTNSDQTPQGT